MANPFLDKVYSKFPSVEKNKVYKSLVPTGISEQETKDRPKFYGQYFYNYFSDDKQSALDADTSYQITTGTTILHAVHVFLKGSSTTFQTAFYIYDGNGADTAFVFHVRLPAASATSTLVSDAILDLRLTRGMRVRLQGSGTDARIAYTLTYI